MKFFLTIAFAVAVAGSALAAQPQDIERDKAMLQAAMFQHIDQQLVNGSFLKLNLADGAIQQLAPAKAHPMILTMDDKYVLCTTFMSKTGENVDLDFYLARSENGFVVFHQEIDNRKPLEALIGAGKVKPLE